MRLPQIKTKHKIRDKKICMMWAQELKTAEEIAEQFGISARRVYKILYTNREFLQVEKDWERTKRIRWLRKQIMKKGGSKKDPADLLEQLRKEIEGDESQRVVIDQSQHTYFTKIGDDEKLIEEARKRGIALPPEIERRLNAVSKSE